MLQFLLSSGHQIVGIFFFKIKLIVYCSGLLLLFFVCFFFFRCRMQATVSFLIISCLFWIIHSLECSSKDDAHRT